MLKDEGNTVDPISGNEVPPGAMQEEVRDDVPAQLSEGEFVFPADVVRYWGLSTLMQMRQEAKEGLAQMDAMGQMGNPEEAVISDDVGQFPVPNIDVDQLMAQEQPQLAAKGGDIKKYKEGGDVTYEDVMGTSPFEIPALSTVPTAYINKKTGEIIYLPHRDGKLFGMSKPPAGYELASEADLVDTPEEAAPQVQQVQVKDKPDNENKLGNNPQYGGGASRISGQNFSVRYGADGKVFIANEASDREAGFSSPQWMELTPEVAGELGFTAENEQGVSKDSLIGEASFGNSAGGWLGNPERVGAKEKAQNTISGFMTKRKNAHDLATSYKNHLYEKYKQKQVTNDKYFGGINKILNSVGNLVSQVSPTNLISDLSTKKVADSTGTASNNNSQNNDTSQNNNTNDQVDPYQGMSSQEKRDYSINNIEAAAARQQFQKRNDGQFGDDLKDQPKIYAAGGRHGGFKEGGLASKKKKYSKGGKVKKSKKGLATQLELGI